ncbi:multiple epidermal growth factor-like domains protein 10 isoform X2 [Haliotis rufescens]|uniref:multiple epidermal growth factor-like domains protein 10 isoform X2 n=1 Tax=Haliotis rufescens TaxID=6454 RepID=UPI00201F408F|nr:multiple epidermal growth factor-like domains protein 10 isoform X2 [Haliotis rufescens]
MYRVQVQSLAVILLVFMIESASADKKHCDGGCKISAGGLTCQTCKHGCYGNRCSQRCRHCDSAGCDRQTGRCYRCRSGHYGAECHRRCPSCPTINKGDAHCDRHTGACIKTCSRRQFGTLCNKRCSSTCKHSMCRKQNGHCYLGCKARWKGLYCNETCTNTCVRGVCHNDGVCKHGCISGFYGQLCDRKCPPGLSSGCDRLTGCSPSCSNGTCTDGCDDVSTAGGDEDDKLNRKLLIVGAGIAAITIIIIGLITACCIHKHYRMVNLKRKKQHGKIAYMGLGSPVYLGAVSREVKLKH